MTPSFQSTPRPTTRPTARRISMASTRYEIRPETSERSSLPKSVTGGIMSGIGVSSIILVSAVSSLSIAIGRDGETDAVYISLPLLLLLPKDSEEDPDDDSEAGGENSPRIAVAGFTGAGGSSYI